MLLFQETRLLFINDSLLLGGFVVVATGAPAVATRAATRMGLANKSTPYSHDKAPYHHADTVTRIISTRGSGAKRRGAVNLQAGANTGGDTNGDRDEDMGGDALEELSPCPLAMAEMMGTVVVQLPVRSGRRIMLGLVGAVVEGLPELLFDEGHPFADEAVALLRLVGRCSSILRRAHLDVLNGQAALVVLGERDEHVGDASHEQRSNLDDLEIQDYGRLLGLCLAPHLQRLEGVAQLGSDHLAVVRTLTGTPVMLLFPFAIVLLVRVLLQDLKS